MHNDNLITVNSLYSVLKSKNKTSYVMNDGNIIIKKGSNIGIIGESGSGKTEFIKAITGTQDMIPGIIKGSVVFHIENEDKKMYNKDNRNKYTLSKINKTIKKKIIGYIPQDPKSYLNPYWKIKKIFMEMYKIKKRSKKINEFIKFYLDQVDLNYLEYQNKFPHQLSGGEAQRVMIALILSKEPDLIIADEISTGLDVSRQRKIIDSFKKIESTNKNLTMIFISHDLGFLSHVVDEYYVLYGGLICEHITDKKEFLDLDNLHPYTKDLISSLVPNQSDNNITHDEISTSLLNKPLKSCPYFNVKCKGCNRASHFHDRIPPMFDDNGNSSNINLNDRWKRSVKDNE